MPGFRLHQGLITWTAMLILGVGDLPGQQARGPLQNGALVAPMGQGLDLVYKAEPLGKGRFRLRTMNTTYEVVLPQEGQGSSYTGNYGMAYGFLEGVDLSLAVPFYLDAVDEFNKYGTGDPVLGVKWTSPAKVPARAEN